MTLKFVPIQLPDGSTVELISVTSMLKLFENKEQMGTRSFYRGDTASDIGKQTHAIINRINQGEIIGSEEWFKLLPSVQQAVRAYIRWKKATDYKSRLSEFQVYSLEHGYCGKLDDLGTIKRFITICDWTSGILKLQYKKLQLVAYRQAYLEMNPGRRVSGLRVVVLNKKTGAFTEEVLTEDEVLNLFNEFLELKNKVGIL